MLRAQADAEHQVSEAQVGMDRVVDWRDEQGVHDGRALCAAGFERREYTLSVAECNIRASREARIGIRFAGEDSLYFSRNFTVTSSCQATGWSFSVAGSYLHLLTASSAA